MDKKEATDAIHEIDGLEERLNELVEELAPERKAYWTSTLNTEFGVGFSKVTDPATAV